MGAIVLAFTVLLALRTSAAWAAMASNSGMRQAPDDLALEWRAVQAVLPAGVDAHALLYPAMNATGSLAIEQAGVLGLAPDAYLAAQQHPLQMMDAIQRAIRRFDRGPYGVSVAE